MDDKNNLSSLKKIVLTGGPCCGKTTLIEELNKRGYPVLHETAREVLNEGKLGLQRYDEFQIEIIQIPIMLIGARADYILEALNGN